MTISRYTAIILVTFLPLLANAQGDAFTKKYAGTYHMLSAGQKVTATTDKYVLKPDGKAIWTFSSSGADGKVKPTSKNGTWSASEGTIHLSFDMGEGEGSELISDFKFENGAFHGSEGIYLKKEAPKAKSK